MKALLLPPAIVLAVTLGFAIVLWIIYAMLFAYR